MCPTADEVVADPTILTAEQAVNATADPLPPPGFARDEEKRRRAEALRAAADVLDPDHGTVDPSVFDVENEIGQYADAGQGLDGSEVSGALDEYVYHWEQADIHNKWGGVWVTQAKSIGWEVVSGSMPEANERRYVDGTRRWGDTILMRIQRERYERLQLADRRRRLARSEGVSAAVLEHAERAGVVVHDLESTKTPRHIKQMAQAQRAAAESARSTMVSHMKQARGERGELAANLAARKFDGALRSGKVPGMPAPGVR